MKRNLIIIHGYNGGIDHTFGPYIEKEAEKRDIKVYSPKFPLAQEATYKGWKEIFDKYVKEGIINENTIMIGHSIGATFIPRYLADHNLSICLYIGLAGFLDDCSGREEISRVFYRFKPKDEEAKKSITLMNHRYAIYSDNDHINPKEELERFADFYEAKKVFVPGIGHMGQKVKIREIPQIIQIIDEIIGEENKEDKNKMKYINQEKINHFKFDLNNLAVIIDFDRTLTKGDSESSWGVMPKSGVIDKEYLKDRQNLYEYYRPIEIDLTLEFSKKEQLIKEWYEKHMRLFFKYKITKKNIKEAVENAMKMEILKYRKGAREFLEYLNKNDVPIILLSAGIGNIIEEFLKVTNTNYDNIHIFSNYMYFENNELVNFSENITHSLNKKISASTKQIKEICDTKKELLLFGDVLEDAYMVEKDQDEKTVKVAFLEEKIKENFEIFAKKYDIVLTNNSSFDDVKEILSL